MKFKINIKKQWKKMLLFIVISVFIAAFLILSEEETPEPSPIKDDYSVQEILSTLYHNYAKIKNLQMNISTTWIRPVRKNIAIKLNILDTQLTDILDDEDSLKLSTEGVDIGRHADLGLIGYYRSKRYETKFFILINWINKFYKSLILFPRGYKLIGDAAFEDIEVTKLKKKGYYLLETSLKDKRVYANFTVNMQYGAIDELNVVSFQTITNNIEGVVDIPTMINAKFSHYADFKGIVFPQYIRISYFSPVVHYVFHTAVNEASFNQKIEKDQFNLMTAHNRRRWYNDPSWVSSDKLVMIKGTGWEVRDVEGRARKIDQDHYIILKDIHEGTEKLIKKIFTSKDYFKDTKYLFTADFNSKKGILAYAVTPARENTNEELEKITGLFLMNIKDKKVTKISDKGFIPLWSPLKEYLIWNETADQWDDEKNNIWICNADGKNKRLLISDGFHYEWGINDKTLLFERGRWSFLRGYPTDEAVEPLQRIGGIYSYSFEQDVSGLIRDKGCNPHFTPTMTNIIFTDLNTGREVYSMGLNDNEETFLFDVYSTNDIILNAFISPAGSQIYFIKATGSDTDKYGLYQFSIKDNAFGFISNEMGRKGIFNYYLDHSKNKKYLMYRSYHLNDPSFGDWGIFKTGKKSILFQDSTFLNNQ